MAIILSSVIKREVKYKFMNRQCFVGQTSLPVGRRAKRNFAQCFGIAEVWQWYNWEQRDPLLPNLGERALKKLFQNAIFKKQ